MPGTDPNWSLKSKEVDKVEDTEEEARRSTPETDAELRDLYDKANSSTLKSCNDPGVHKFLPGIDETTVNSGKFEYLTRRDKIARSRAWIVWISLLLLFVSLQLNGYQYAEKRSVVYVRSVVLNGCSDYLAAPLIRCDPGTYLREQTCVCFSEWDRVEDETVRIMAVHQRPSGYLVAWWEAIGVL